MAKILGENEENPCLSFLQPIFHLIPGTRSATTAYYIIITFGISTPKGFVLCHNSGGV